MTEGRVLSGIEFARAGDDGSRPLLLDLYLPGPEAGAAPRPAVVHFHGGGWRMGERSSLGPVLDGFGISAFETLTDAGFVVASADYRLSREAHFPAQLHDAKAAVRWLRNHAADYNVDPARIYAWGDSAGGHLASLVGLTANADGANADGANADGVDVGADAAVAAVAAWYPPTDLGRMAEQSLPAAVARADDPGSREELLVGAVLADEPARAAEASPISYASRSAPPFFLAHGTSDRFVPAAQSASLAAALEGAGAAVELLLIEGADHMWILPDHSQAAAEKAMAATVAFFLRQSRPPDTQAT
ncbi:alpha/beta hydrolase [Arthrobacter sp. ES3-54]|uniref:alpha/beta hydrolase n=1 Tax=Arthrobacter sp. ES3-54 TaxID=1502991 RepID=UPI002404D455|nr:alpha/beta hydrolase [Arthrobacter sp. ES3-54]MDF9749349.1 acetyl esterase/lipase [Arthrobacter sp. ES3-54]